MRIQNPIGMCGHSSHYGWSLDHRLVFAHDHDIVERDENAHGREDGHGRADVAVEIVIGAEGYQLRREGQPVGPDVSLIAGRPTIFRDPK